MADQIAEMDVFKRIYDLDFLQKKIILLKPFVEDGCSRNDIATLINSDELQTFTKDLKKMCIYSVLLNPLVEQGDTVGAELFKQMIQNIAQIYSSLKELKKSINIQQIDTQFEKVSTLFTNLKNIKVDTDEMKELTEQYKSTLETYYNESNNNENFLELETHLFDIQTCMYELYGMLKTKKKDINSILEIDLKKFKVKNSFNGFN